MLAKAVATESSSTFFSLSAASLTSKWVGESEKLVRALFKVARERAPSVIFIDEIDSLLRKRSANEQEGSRRLKTEFLVQMTEISSNEANVLLLAATNTPDEIDEAALRRFEKRIYIKLPCAEARSALFVRAIEKHGGISLSRRDLAQLTQMTDGYSCSDLDSLLKEAALYPLREIHPSKIRMLKPHQIRPVNLNDFAEALRVVKPSVAKASLLRYDAFDKN